MKIKIIMKIMSNIKAALENWQEIRVSEVCENLDNLRKPVTKSKREPGKIPYYGATGIVDYVKDYIFDEELVLIGEDGADWSKFANTAFIAKGKSWVNNHAHVLRCKKIDPYFFKEYLNFKDLNVYTTGTTRGKLNKQSLMNIKLLIPLLSEQKEIAKILSTVDKDIEKTDQIIKKTEKLKKGLMQRLLTRGIGHKKFKKTKFGEIPEEWEVVKIKDLIELKYGKGLPQKNRINGDIPVYGSNGIVDYHNEYFVKGPGIVVGRKGTIGSIKIVESNFWPIDTTYFIEMKNNVNLRWLFYKLQSIGLKNMNRATGVPGLNREDVYSIYIAVPDVIEQKKLAKVLLDVDNKIEINKQIKNKLTQLKKGLMQDLLSGRVRVK
jgi:type I restriction enzyme S subunit